MNPVQPSCKKSNVSEDSGAGGAYFYTLFNTMNEGVCLHEILYDRQNTPVDYTILDVNPAYEAITGISRDRALSRKASELYGTGEAPFLDIYARVADTGEPHAFELFWPPMKKHFLVSVCAQQKGRFATIFSDITVQKEREEQIRASEENLAITLNSIGDAVIATDARGNVQRMNPVAEALTGWKLSDARNQPLNTVFHIINQQTRRPVENPVKKVLQSGKIVGLANHTVLISKDGREFFIDDSAAPIRDAGDKLAGVVLVFRDISEKYRSRAKIRRREAKLKSIFRAAPVGIGVVVDRKIQEINDRFCEISGYARDELVGQSSRLLYLTPNEFEHVGREKYHQISQQGTGSVETRFKRKDGRIIDVLLSSTPIDPQDLSAGVSFTVLDITSRKQSESEKDITIKLLSALHAQNDLHALVRQVTQLMQNWSGCEAVGIRLRQGEDYPYFETRGFPAEFVSAERCLCAVDDAGDLIRDSVGNPVLECMCGNVIRGRFDPELPFFTENGSFWTNSTTDLLASTSAADRQARTRNRCQGEGYESVALVPLDAGGDRIGLMQFNDSRKNCFNDRKIALFERLASNLAIGLSQRTTALALQESEERYRSMMASTEDPTYICAPDFRIEYVNPAMTKMLGRDATGELCYQALHGRAAVCPGCVHAQVLRGETVSLETRGPQEDRIFHVSNAPIFHADGSVSKLTMFRDISAIKGLEARIQQAQKMESIGNLAGGVAHDFNNILFPMMGMAELLMEDMPAGSQAAHNARVILDAGKRGSDLVKQILAFSRQSDHKLAPVRVQRILQEVLKLSRSTIPANIEISADIQKDCRPVLADPTQVHQIAMNLITNAYHAVASAGGQIALQLREITIGPEIPADLSLVPGPYVRMTVSDTGTGIEPAILEKIFEPYFTTKSQDKGTGLGLAVVYGIVKEHRGDIMVSSKIGEGTTFNVYLPQMEKPEEERPVGETVSQPGGQERILLVDDEPAIIVLARQMLQRLGYRVTTRVSSVEALEAFRTDPGAYDLVVTDMTMPVMTGDRLAVELLAIRPDLPVLICTGFSDKLNPERAAAIGIKGFLMKPVIKSELARTVREVLDGACRSTRET